MSKIIITILLIFNSIGYSQNDSINKNEFVLKVYPIRPKQIIYPCEDFEKKGLVQEFEVVNLKDIKKYGKFLYVIVPCFEALGEGVFSHKNLFDLKISKVQYFKGNFIIENEKLLKKNKHKIKYWFRDINRKVILNCSIYNNKE